MSVIAETIAGRHHVSTPDLDVVRAARDSLMPSARRRPELREARRELYRQVIEAHRRNRDLFVAYRF